MARLSSRNSRRTPPLLSTEQPPLLPNLYEEKQRSSRRWPTWSPTIDARIRSRGLILHQLPLYPSEFGVDEGWYQAVECSDPILPQCKHVTNIVPPGCAISNGWPLRRDYLFDRDDMAVGIGEVAVAAVLQTLQPMCV